VDNWPLLPNTGGSSRLLSNKLELVNDVIADYISARELVGQNKEDEPVYTHDTTNVGYFTSSFTAPVDYSIDSDRAPDDGEGAHDQPGFHYKSKK
jgi:hypothetical protein